MTAVEFPLFIRAKDSGEIWVCNSPEETQYGLEQIDVENEEYEAWDKNGLPIRLEVQLPMWLKLSPLRPVENPEALTQAVMQFAKSVGLELKREPTLETIGTVLADLRAAQEHQRDEKSSIRRFIKRFR